VPGVNCLIGPGDTGKSTILSAICLLLAPYPVQQASEFDYFQREVNEGFCIEAYVGGFDPAVFSSVAPLPSFCGWLNGKPVPFPDENGAETVLHCGVRGTRDLEVVHEILNDNQPPTPFTVGHRKKLLLTRLAGEERANRDLRLGTGTLLERYLDPSNIRRAIYDAVTSASNALQMPEGVVKNLKSLGTLFEEEGLPATLHLGLFPQSGNAASGMVALFTGEEAGRAIPLTYSGTGTKQLTLLSLSMAMRGENPIIAMDEPERGLEPYRQRLLMKRLVEAVGTKGQAFLTTHSPAILSSLVHGSMWRTRTGEKSPVQVNTQPLSDLLENNPEAFFAPVPVFCEGLTEVGLLRALMPKFLNRDLNAAGIRLIDGKGQPQVLDTIGEFHTDGLPCAAFLDNEDEHSGKRTELKDKCELFVWESVKNIEEALGRHLPISRFEELFLLAGRGSKNRARSMEDQVRTILFPQPPPERRPFTEIFAVCGEECVRRAVVTAMSDNDWFKNEELGFELGSKLLQWGVPPFIEKAVRAWTERLL
jgi:putative ATP-dependent endonuclease of OLD family